MVRQSNCSDHMLPKSPRRAQLVVQKFIPRQYYDDLAFLVATKIVATLQDLLNEQFEVSR